MTEATWLSSTDPQAMLDSLLAGVPTPGGYDMGHGLPPSSPRVAAPVSERKLRLWCIACEQERAIPRHDPYLHQLEEYADEGRTLRQGAKLAWGYNDPRRWPHYLFYPHECPGSETMAALLRDIFGNPWRPVHLVDPVEEMGWPPHKYFRIPRSWLTWRDGLIPTMARTMYDARNFADMTILADALEEAGCSNEEILNHCRGLVKCNICDDLGTVYTGGVPPYSCCAVCKGTKWVKKANTPHARGCFVLDLILGKN